MKYPLFRIKFNPCGRGFYPSNLDIYTTDSLTVVEVFSILSSIANLIKGLVIFQIFICFQSVMEVKQTCLHMLLYFLQLFYSDTIESIPYIEI